MRRTCGIKPLIAAIGSCCLVGFIWQGTLYVANLGDSRAVIGSLGRFNKIIAEQLTRDHNASMEEVRQELRSRHPDDSHIVVMKHGVWRIKGIIQVCSFSCYLLTWISFCRSKCTLLVISEDIFLEGFLFLQSDCNYEFFIVVFPITLARLFAYLNIAVLYSLHTCSHNTHVCACVDEY